MNSKNQQSMTVGFCYNLRELFKGVRCLRHIELYLTDEDGEGVKVGKFNDDLASTVLIIKPAEWQAQVY